MSFAGTAIFAMPSPARP